MVSMAKKSLIVVMIGVHHLLLRQVFAKLLRVSEFVVAFRFINLVRIHDFLQINSRYSTNISFRLG